MNKATAKLAFSATCLLLGATVAANASPYVVTLQDAGSNVIATGSGSIDLTGLSLEDGTSRANHSYVSPTQAIISTGGCCYITYETEHFTGPTSFGTGGATFANQQSGSPVGIYVPSASELVVYALYPYGGGSISSSATWNNTTIASLGITPGTYTWSWGSGADQSFTLDVATTPLPASLPLFAAGLGGLGLLGWTRKRKAAAV